MTPAYPYRSLLWVIGIILTVSHTGWAQRKEDVVRLKNGSVLRGKIVEMDTVVAIETVGRNWFVFPKSDVRSITEERAVIPYKLSGYILALETGVLSGRTIPQNAWGNPSNASVSTFTFHLINGYQFNQYLAASLGIGVDAYAGAAITPVYVRISGDVLPYRITPVYMVDAGYGFYSSIFNGSFGNDQITYRGGVMLNPAIGMRVRMGRHSSLLLSMGYRQQRYVISGPVTTQPGDLAEDTHTLKRLSLRIGFSF